MGFIDKKTITDLRNKYNKRDNIPSSWIYLGDDKYIDIVPINNNGFYSLSLLDKEGSLDGRNHYRNSIKLCEIQSKDLLLKTIKTLRNIFNIL